MKVFILTYCRNLGQLYGSTLVFDTLRVGFPNAEITVFDNNSLPDARFEIERLALRAGCRSVMLDREIAHDEFLSTVCSQEAHPICFVDPDVCFWNSVEEFDPRRPLAGRYLPAFQDEFSQTLTFPRLHTSLLFVRSPKTLLGEIKGFPRMGAREFNPWKPAVFREPRDGGNPGRWVRYDTGSALYHALDPHVEHFGSEMLDRYEHLFFGSYLNEAIYLKDDARDYFEGVHAEVKRGGMPVHQWRQQDMIFESRKVS